MFTFQVKLDLSGHFSDEAQVFDQVVHESVDTMVFETKVQLQESLELPGAKVQAKKPKLVLNPETQTFTASAVFSIQLPDSSLKHNSARAIQMLEELRSKIQADERILHDFVAPEDGVFPDVLYSDFSLSLTVLDPISNRTRRRNLHARMAERTLQGSRLPNNTIGVITSFLGKLPASNSRPLPPALSNTTLRKGPTGRQLNALQKARKNAYTRTQRAPAKAPWWKSYF
jgi:hypothetical protein